MSDYAVLALAATVCAGAQFAGPVPRWVAVLAVGAAALSRRSLLVVLAGGLCASALAAAAWAGLAEPVPRRVDTVATVAGDPDEFHGAVRIDVRLGHRRAEAWARDDAAAVLRNRLAGELVRLRGWIRPVPPRLRDRLAVRHIAARLDVLAVGSWRRGSRASALTNGLRRTLVRGAASLRHDNRSLLLGVVLGDDHEQSRELGEAFRSSGLSHLLVVSGENVAFVLALFGPLLRRMSLGGRWATTLVVLGLFGLLTRWEPSVLRAGAMAAIACTATTLGRPTSRLRLLALAVTMVVLLDPLVVDALGFRLSVGATAGIALLAAPISRRLRGPRVVTEPLAITIAAQIGVAPIALPAFGSLPLASLPANVLAVPAAAPLTAWGLTGGVLAGLAGPPFDRWLHLPTRLLTWWLAAVARRAGSLPLGDIRASHALVLAVLALAWWSIGSRRWKWRSARTASTSPPERS